MAEVNPQTVTIGDLAKIYQEEQDLKKPLSLGPMAKFKDTPALEFFDESGDDISEARKLIKASEGQISENSMKATLKNMRYLSNRLYNAYDRNPPEFLVSNEKNVPKAAQEFFGVKEPPKAVSTLDLTSEPEIRQQFFDELLDYGAKNPDKMPHVRAIVFGLNTGLRPNANIGINTGQYIPRKGALFIRPEVTGAKGRSISIPLNNIADSMLQQQVQLYKDSIDATRKPLLDKDGKKVIDPETGQPKMGPGRIWVDTKGKPLKTKDINDVLEQIKVEEIVYDSATGQFYDSLKPVDGDSSKFGMSLFRNWHTTISRKIGVNDLVLAKLQGRSTKSYGKGSTGELSTYDSQYPGDVSDFEREEANKLTQTFGPQIESAKSTTRQYNDPDFNFDWGGDEDVVKTRVTEATEGYGRAYFEREVVDQAPKTKPGSRLSETAAQMSDDDIIGKILKGFGKTAVVLPAVGIPLALSAKKAEAEEMIAEGTPEFLAYGQKGAEFVAEEFTPYGTAKDIVGAAGAQAEAYQERGKQLLEESTTQTEEELLRSFGEFGAEVRGIK